MNDKPERPPDPDSANDEEREDRSEIRSVGETSVTVAEPPEGANQPAQRISNPDSGVNAVARDQTDASREERPPRELQSIGRYKLRGLLGSGGQGSVFLAHDPLLDRLVAIKSMNQPSTAALSRLLTEARYTARLDHPNICSVYDIIADGLVAHIVMEYVDGATLAHLVKTTPPTVSQTVRLLRQIASGLSLAHEQGIVHCDLKGENVLVAAGGTAKITDFGLAGPIDGGEVEKPSGRIRGTPRAMSPEQSFGETATTKSDLFSFGVLCYEALCRTSPFLASSVAETLRRLRSVDPPAPSSINSEISEATSSLVLRLLRKSPDERPESVEEVAAELASIAKREARASVPRATGERRQVTLLSCDLALQEESETEEPDELFEAAGPYRSAVEAALHQFGGTVHTLHGTSYLACFGFPQRCEDGAARAGRCALAVREAVETLKGSKWTVRCGIHTGVIVVPTGSDAIEEVELARLPRIVNLLKERAESGEVLVGTAASEAMGGLAALAPPVEVRIGRTRELARRLDRILESAAFSTDVAPKLFGRSEPLSAIVARCRGREAGPSVVLVSGEPGIGKSTLIAAARARLQTDFETWLLIAGTPETTNAPLHSVAHSLRLLTDCPTMLSREAQLDRCVNWLESIGAIERRHLPGLCRLFGLQLPSRYALSEWATPEKQRSVALDSLADLFATFAARQSLCVLVDDAHWLDASSVDLLRRLGRLSAPSRLAVIVATRPEGIDRLGTVVEALQLRLGPLTDADSEALLLHAAGTRIVTRARRREILRKGAGNPLFIDQLARQAREEPSMNSLPPSLADLVGTRLDALGELKPVAQIASVLGYSFSLATMSSVADQPEQHVRRTLLQLAEHQIVETRDDAGLFWSFAHALIADAAHDSLLAPRRRELHRRAKEATEALPPQAEERHPQRLAYHCERADLPAEAVQYWMAAGAMAAEQFAMEDAFRAYRRGLAQLSLVEETPARALQEITLLAQCGIAGLSARGYANVTVAECFSKADALCQRLGQRSIQLFAGVWATALMRGDKEKTRESIEYVEKTLLNTTSPAERLYLLNVAVTYRFWTGQVDSALESCRLARQAFSAETHAQAAKDFGGSGGYYGNLLFPILLARSGEVEQSNLEQRRVLLAAESLDPFTFVETSVLALWRAFDLEQFEQVQSISKRAFELSDQYGYATYTASEKIVSGWLQVWSGTDDSDGSVNRMTEGIETLIRLADFDSLTGLASWVAWHADALQRLGRTSAALDAVERALVMLETHLDQSYHAEMLTRKARLLVELRRLDAAKKVFQDAADLAHASGHRLFELKAHLSMLTAFSDTPRDRAQQVLNECHMSDGEPLLQRASSLGLREA